MTIVKTLLCLLFTLNQVLSSPVFTPCKSKDVKCIEKSINDAIPILTSADKSLGTESSDPMHIDSIDGDLSVIKYKFTNATSTGYKRCVAQNLKPDLDKLKFHLDLVCPSFRLRGKYIISGVLISIPIEGEGTFDMVSGKYRIGIDGQLKKTQGKDGKTYVTIRSIKLKNEALEPITYTMDNLFNGRKDLSDAVHKFANGNWKAVAELLQDPVFYTSLKKLISNVNKHLKTTPLEDLML